MTNSQTNIVYEVQIRKSYVQITLILQENLKIIVKNSRNNTTNTSCFQTEHNPPIN